ncbi:hypothetical protein C9374_002849 [Naegleria lovaniensis]|uniref:Frataxin n=1 Tax=Naegleria lovaniensis TaxID=51637 RepID=A0AA88GU92_NAELO|nr:uncharacterized protein C9374_002849 [Naegleria lovaniensis]KAG2386403.1 hypothetical protein C9374_002849 [Naegleria lovaniensis]
MLPQARLSSAVQPLSLLLRYKAHHQVCKFSSLALVLGRWKEGMKQFSGHDSNHRNFHLSFLDRSSSSSTQKAGVMDHTSLGDFPFTQTQYLQAINRSVDQITQVLDEFYENETEYLEEKGIDMEVEGGHDGVVNIKISTSKSNGPLVFVISRQTPARELWLSSALSGPWHFKYDHVADDWICTREGHPKFWVRLQKELSQVLEKEIKFEKAN